MICRSVRSEMFIANRSKIKIKLRRSVMLFLDVHAAPTELDFLNPS